MSNIAELAVLKRQIEELKDHVKDIDHGLSKKERNLRDEFAKAALPACYANFVRDAETLGYMEDWRHGVALDAYMMADAMLKARNETPPDRP